MMALSIWLTIQTVLMVSEGVATPLGWAMPITPRPFRNYTRGEQFITVLTILSTMSIWRILFLKIWQKKKKWNYYTYWKTHKPTVWRRIKKEKEKTSIHSYMYYNCIKINFFWLPIISSMLESSINRHGNRCEFQSLKVIFTGFFLLLLTWERTNLMYKAKLF